MNYIDYIIDYLMRKNIFTSLFQVYKSENTLQKGIYWELLNKYLIED